MKALVLSLMVLAGAAQGGEAVVEAATAEPAGAGAWRISVTLSHGDTGWDHYADGWGVETEAGKALGFRELLHPHVTEQPFTRSLGGVRIPEGVSRVYIRARDSVHGWSEDRVPLDLPD
jgi:hypothetical protein